MVKKGSVTIHTVYHSLYPSSQSLTFSPLFYHSFHPNILRSPYIISYPLDSPALPSLQKQCHRELSPDRPVLSSEEERLLARICDAYYLPAWAPASEYVTAMTNEGLQVSGETRRPITHTHIVSYVSHD